MSVKLHHTSSSFLSTSTSTQWFARKANKYQYLYRVVDSDQTDRAVLGKTFLRCSGSSKYSHSCSSLKVWKQDLFSLKSKRAGRILRSASNDDGVTVNGSPEASTSRDVEAMRIRLDQALKNEDYNDGLVQSLYDAARVFELSIKERSLFSKIPWFSAAWLGVDKNAWAKALSYQAAVYVLLQAANETASHADGRDREVNVVVQRSLLRLSAPLESIVREKLSGKQPQLFEWFWSEQIPVVVTTFVNHFERDPRFKAATTSGKRMAIGLVNASDISLLVLALVCSSVITKLGPAKVSCSQVFSMIPDITGNLMDVLVGIVPIHEAYHTAKEIGLQRDFLVHFGPRAASCGISDDCMTDEIIFWVDLVQKQLQRAIDREKIWSRLTTSESIEILERDLSIIGFFVALGRSTRSFLAANGYDKIDEPMESLIRYLVGGCVLYYPQLSPISSYELYVEIVCEELDWLPFYPGYTNTFKRTHEHKNNSEVPPNAEAIQQALDVCSRWIRIFDKHSKWVENPSNVKASSFLSKGLKKVGNSMEELGLQKIKSDKFVQRAEDNSSFSSVDEPDSFDRALESVEQAVVKLEMLLQEMHVTSSASGKEQLKAACSDLEKIRKLKKEAEFLEASFRAKAAFLQEENDDDVSNLNNGEREFADGKDRGLGSAAMGNNNSDPRGLWAFLVRPPVKNSARGSSKEYKSSDPSSLASGKSDSSDIHRFEILRSELTELEKRVQRNTSQSESEEKTEYANVIRGTELVPVQKNGSLIEKSLEKLKETSTEGSSFDVYINVNLELFRNGKTKLKDVWQGTQLLAIDAAASTGLLRRAVIGDELTEKEKKFLRRNITDLASVVPIGVLMLLPVTAVGHAAMLAAIQRYMPALIPSTYGSERLDLLRQLEKMKQIDTGDANLDENVEELT